MRGTAQAAKKVGFSAMDRRISIPNYRVNTKQQAKVDWTIMVALIAFNQEVPAVYPIRTGICFAALRKPGHLTVQRLEGVQPQSLVQWYQ